MSSVAYPGFLWGFLGLAIPIAIHLLSRKEGKIIRFGSLRYLRSTESPTFKSIKINEILLLSFRCLLLGVMVLFICELMIPAFSKSEDKKWILLDPVIEVEGSIKKVLDSLKSKGFELRSLEKGFPTTPVNGSETDYWMLVEDLKKVTYSKVIVFSSNQMIKFNGKRISLPANVSWVSVPVTGKDFLVEAVIQNEQEVKIRKAIYGADNLMLEYLNRPNLKSLNYIFEGEDSVLITNPDTVHVSIVATDNYQYDKKIILAAFDAIDKSTDVFFEISNYKSAKKTDWIFWLSDEAPPVGLSCIILKDEQGVPFLQQVSPRRWQLSKRLNLETASKYQLTTELFNLVVPMVEDRNSGQNDMRVLPDPVLWSSEGESEIRVKATTSTNQQLMLVIIVVLFLIERVMAFNRRL